MLWASPYLHYQSTPEVSDKARSPRRKAEKNGKDVIQLHPEILLASDWETVVL